MKKIFILPLALVLNGLFLSHNAHAILPQVAPSELKAFMDSDFDSIHSEALKTHAVPLKILLPALILEGRSQGWIASDSYDYQAVFKRAGLTYPDNVIFNSKIYAWKSNILPAGLVQKEMNFGIGAKVKMANLSCVACHSGSEYDQRGVKLNNLILGAPSDSFNPEVYVGSIYQGMKKVSQNWELTYKMIDHLFPETKIREKLLLKTFIRMQVNSYVKKHSALDRGTPFNNGGPGLTNGVASLKNVLGLDTAEGSDTGFTSIPSLGDRGFRSSLLYDGVYSIANKDNIRAITNVTNAELKDAATIVTLFTIPTMGQTQKRALKNIDRVVQIVSPILKNYKTPEYPGTIDGEAASRGMDVYNHKCMQCHGEYKWDGGKKSKLVTFPNALVPQSEMNSDPQRWMAMNPTLINNLENSVWRDLVQINQNRGYIAPILEGLWASAPYMHNGSVPTLWNFLRPESRPAKFIVGNQNLDLEKVGSKGVQNSGSEIYDTSLSGRSNQGHEREFERISESEKDDLLEFLKTL